MLKLNASYAKKVPAEEEYSSQSYHASIEVELPDGLSGEALQERIHATFNLVRNSVEAELHGKNLALQPDNSRQNELPNHAQNNSVQRVNSRDIPASPKQISYLLDLARNHGITPQLIAAQHGVADIQQLSKRQCSELINSWRAA